VSRPTVTAFRGDPGQGRGGSGGAGLPPAEPASPPASPRAEARLLHPVPARAMGFLALALFGSMHWMRMLEPAAPQRAWWAIGAAVVLASGLLAAAAVRGWARAAIAAIALTAGVALAVLAAGAGDEMLKPARWDDLVAGVARGVDSLAGARVPYRGLDEWVRLAIPLGGTLLLVVSAALAFWPRRSAIGFPAAALVALVTLYAVPAVALIFDNEFFRGALLALLVLVFLRLERLRRRDAPAAAAVAVLTVTLALILAPALDGIEPWWDYETWALSAASSRSTAFDWDHDYGPLDWPRDGRELLRVKSKQRTYWKADQLDVFDGDRWQQSEDSGIANQDASALLAGVEQADFDRWSEEISVSVRNLRSETFVTAGTVVDSPNMPRRGAIPTSRLGIYRTTRTLQRGDKYTASVYIPRPSSRQLRRASDNYAGYDLGRFTEVVVDPADGGGLTQRDRAAVRFDGFLADPALAVPEEDTAPPPVLFEQSRLARTWELAGRFRRTAGTPYEYVQAVERFLSRDFDYAERPPPGSETLDGFLFETKTGYCQQFSGAMALLLRMGGIPARVATGFSPGSLDRDSGEFVVRDYDAHSWVEVWFTGIGWVPFDPTPTTAPPRSQAGAANAASAAVGDIGDLGTATYDPRRDGEAVKEPRPWGLYAGIAVGTVVLLLAIRALIRHRRRRRPAAGLELERALRLLDGGAAGITLSELERRFAGSERAAGYVRALRAQRYAAAAAGPTAAQRRGLRRALARGRGLGGRLRAWWALPPRLPRSS
jgi:transglutaminase-like putative cysteine protease